MLYKAYYISNQKQKQVDISKFFKDEVNNVFDTNIFRQVTCVEKKINNMKLAFITYIVVNSILTCHK